MFLNYLLLHNVRPFRRMSTVIIMALLVQPYFIGCSRKPPVNLPPPSEQPATRTPAVRTSYADVVNLVSKAVVTIRTESRVRAPRQFPFRDDPFFRRFFGDQMPPIPDRLRRGLGSGVIITTDGYILTNDHVVDGADQIEVELQEQQIVSARLVGSDPPSDLALLKVERVDLVALTLADSDKVQVGDVVLAIGNPLGIGKTVTMGIISAKSRRTGLSNGSFEDFLQTDAAISRGNSGGALVDGNGNLIGINSQILSPSGGSIGIGFAIPSNMARDVLDQLLKHGKVQRGHLGIVVQSVTKEIAASLGLNFAKGVIVSQVQARSAAERAGVRRGDVILALNGQPVTEPNAFRNDVAATPPGRTVTLRIWRGGNEQELRATLGEFVFEQPSAQTSQNDQQQPQVTDTGRLGLSVQPLTPALAGQLGLPSETIGIVVIDVDPSGPAADAGIQRGDVIEEVNQQRVRTADELRTIVENSGNKPLLLLVNHRGTTVFVTVRPR